MAAETFKPQRTLRLTTPFMTGADIKIVQRRLGEKLTIDGEYGPATASAVKAWKHRVGFSAGEVNTGLGVKGQQIMFGQRKRTTAMKFRAINRARRRKRELAKLKSQPDYIRKAALKNAVAYDRVSESPPGSNRVPVLRELAGKLGLAPFYQNMGWPWCAFFTFLMALKAGSLTAKEGLAKGKFNALYTPTILQLAIEGKFGMRVISSNQVEAGDFVMMNFPGGDPRVDHTGFARGPVKDGRVPTIEGNTSLFGSQDNGGMVCQKTRPLSEVRAFIRFDVY